MQLYSWLAFCFSAVEQINLLILLNSINVFYFLVRQYSLISFYSCSASILYSQSQIQSQSPEERGNADRQLLGKAKTVFLLLFQEDEFLGVVSLEVHQQRNDEVSFCIFIRNPTCFYEVNSSNFLTFTEVCILSLIE